MEILEPEELAFRAKTARMKAKETQQEAADRFEVHKQTVWAAENEPERSLDSLRQRMIEHYEGVKVRLAWIIESD